jgi:putative ABC transport system permease protein
VGRIREAWRTATSAPWRRAPLLLLRRPGVLAAVAGATAVVVAAIAAVPLFVSAAGTAAVDLQAGERCPVDTGVSQFVPVDREAFVAGTPRQYGSLPGLTDENRWTVLAGLQLGRAGTDVHEPVSVLTGEGMAEHVEVLDGSTADPGVWITDRAAEATGLGVGDRATVGGHDVAVAAVYRDLAGYTTDRYWCPNNRWLLIESRGGDLVPPPPVVLVDRETMAAIGEANGISRGFGYLDQAALAKGTTITEARRLLDDLACHGDDPKALAWCTPDQPLLTRRFGTPRPAVDDRDFVERWFDSSLPFVVDRAHAIQTAVASGIWPVAAFAALAGAGLVAAAASLWFDRRRRDVELLAVRGVSPLGLGSKAVLELVLPLVVGAVAGIALAYGLVAWLGPSPHVEPGAVGRAVVAAVLGLAGAAVTIAVVVAVRARGVRHGRRRRLALVPWELGLVAATVVSYRRLGQWGVPVGEGAAVSKVDVGGLLFPVLFLLAAVAVASRLLALGLGPLRRLSRTWPTPLFLAVRRVARNRAANLGLLAATALATGVLVYAATMGGSLHATLDAKAKTFVGSDVEADVARDQQLPPALAGRATVVHVHRDARLGGEPVTVVGIDPATFADAAFWDDTFADRSLATLLDDLRPTTGAVPVLVTGLDVDGPTRLEVGQGLPAELTVTEAAHVEAFPGMRKVRPTVFLLDRALADEQVVGVDTELWVRGDRARSLDELHRLGIAFEETRTVTDVVDGSAFVTVSWTFGFMRSLGVAAGLLAVGGVAVHLDARRRERLLGHAFLRRMGLRAAQHRLALLAELVASVLVGAVLGLVAAVAGADLAHGRIDPVPAFAPAPLLRVSASAAVAAGVGSLVVVAVATVVAHVRTERDDPVEVLRAGA